MEIVPLKTQLRFGFVLMVAAVAGLMLSHSIALFSATKPKRSCVFSGTISISQAFRKMEIRIPALRKVKVLLMLETGSWK